MRNDKDVIRNDEGKLVFARDIKAGESFEMDLADVREIEELGLTKAPQSAGDVFQCPSGAKIGEAWSCSPICDTHGVRFTRQPAATGLEALLLRLSEANKSPVSSDWTQAIIWAINWMKEHETLANSAPKCDELEFPVDDGFPCKHDESDIFVTMFDHWEEWNGRTAMYLCNGCKSHGLKYNLDTNKDAPLTWYYRQPVPDFYEQAWRDSMKSNEWLMKALEQQPADAPKCGVSYQIPGLMHPNETCTLNPKHRGGHGQRAVDELEAALSPDGEAKCDVALLEALLNRIELEITAAFNDESVLDNLTKARLTLGEIRDTITPKIANLRKLANCDELDTYCSACDHYKTDHTKGGCLPCLDDGDKGYKHEFTQPTPAASEGK